MNVTDQAKQKMQTAIEHLKSELKGIRTGRANPSMLDNVMVELYGSPMRIKDIASVTTPDARQLLISPFDPQSTNSIAKGIEKANLGFMPAVDGHVIRINIPPMDEARRKKMAAECHEKKEKAKVVVRNIRRECNDDIKKQKSNGDITEDQVKKLEKISQELTDKFCKEADDLAVAKEKEVMHI